MKAKGSALSIAIVFLGLVGLIISSLFLIFNFNVRLQSEIESRNYLILDNLYAIELDLKRSIGSSDTTVIHPSGDTTDIMHSSFGLFNFSTYITHNKQKKLLRQGLVETIIDSNYLVPNLYIKDNKTNSIHYSDQTILNGIISVPNGKLSPSDLLNGIKPDKKYSLQNAIIEPSKPTHLFLPLNLGKIEEQLRKINPTFKTKQTGKIILTSRPEKFSFIFADTIIINPNIDISNCIFYSNYLKVSKNCFGSNIQFYCNKEIILDSNIRLDFPCYTILFGPEQKHLLIDSNSKYQGVICVLDENERLNSTVEMIKSEFAGFFFNSGYTYLSGKITGVVETDNLFSRNNNSTLNNHMGQITIEPPLINYQFVPSFFSIQLKRNNQIVKWIN